MMTMRVWFMEDIKDRLAAVVVASQRAIELVKPHCTVKEREAFEWGIKYVIEQFAASFRLDIDGQQIFAAWSVKDKPPAWIESDTDE